MTEVLHLLPPGTILILGALLAAVLPRRGGLVALLVLPLLSGWHLLTFPVGYGTSLTLFGYELAPIRVDRLSLVWGYIFHIASFLCGIYALHVKDRLQTAMGLAYAGAALGAVFAGDLVTLFVYWEMLALTSVFLIWATRTRVAYRSGMRYLLFQITSGLLLLAGILLRANRGDSMAFDHLGELSDPAALLIFLAFGIKAAFPMLHMWLEDSYPESTATGTVLLSAFTTKAAIYTLARGFAGTEILITIGAVMVAFPIFYAVIENDLRRVLAYSLNNQLGFMVVGIGVGTELGINGAAAHAFAHILYKALLFMSMGAVLFRTGTTNGSDLGGLHKSMPWTTAFCIVGAASISAFPLFSGFAAKSPILTAAAEEHHFWVWLVLVFGSAGVFHHSGIKIPFFAFFGHDRGWRVKEAPLNMLIAMGIASAACVFLGCFPQIFYRILPYPIDYRPYTGDHVISQIQLLVCSSLAFTLLNRVGIYPPELRSVNLAPDWLYRKLMPATARVTLRAATALRHAVLGSAAALVSGAVEGTERLAGPRAILARTWSTSGMVLWAALLLGLYLLLDYRK